MRCQQQRPSCSAHARHRHTCLPSSPWTCKGRIYFPCKHRRRRCSWRWRLEQPEAQRFPFVSVQGTAQKPCPAKQLYWLNEFYPTSACPPKDWILPRFQHGIRLLKTSQANVRRVEGADCFRKQGWPAESAVSQGDGTQGPACPVPPFTVQSRGQLTICSKDAAKMLFCSLKMSVGVRLQKIANYSDMAGSSAGFSSAHFGAGAGTKVVAL